MRTPLELFVFVISIIFYSLIAGLLIVLGVEVVNWTFSYLMGTTILTFFDGHKGLGAIAPLLANQRIMALAFVVGLGAYIYYHLDETN